MKEKEELINYWLFLAESDFETAESLFMNEKYPQCLFFGHLSIEKLLKAYFVKFVESNPPYKHSLVFLADRCNLNLTDEQKDLLLEITSFNMEARYPDIKLKFYKKCNKEYTSNFLKKISEFYIWLKKMTI